MNTVLIRRWPAVRRGWIGPVFLAALAGFTIAVSRGEAPERKTRGFTLPAPNAGLLLPDQSAMMVLAGQWRGDGWGRVELKEAGKGTFVGTYTDTFGEEAGRISLKWSSESRRFEGTWAEGDSRHGRLSVRVHTEGNVIRGAWTTDDDCIINPGVPALADLEWTATGKSDEGINGSLTPW